MTAGPGLDGGTRAWLADTFRLGHPSRVIHVGRGTTSRVWRIDTDQGAFAASQVLGPAPAEHHIRRELAVVDACRGAGVSAPAPTFTAGGEVSATHPETGQAWRLHSFADGRAQTHGDVPTDLWLARQLGLIHALALPTEPGEPAEDCGATVDVDWDALAEDALAEGISWAPTLARRRPELVELSAMVNAASRAPMVCTHRNAMADKTVLSRDGGRCLLSWRHVGPLVPERELGVLMLDHIGSEPVLRGLAAAYRGAGGTGDVGDSATFATGLARWLTRLGARALAVVAQPDERRPVEDAAVAELAHRIPTPAHLQRALRRLSR